jgi:hypothetical protein
MRFPRLSAADIGCRCISRRTHTSTVRDAQLLTLRHLYLVVTHACSPCPTPVSTDSGRFCEEASGEYGSARRWGVR